MGDHGQGLSLAEVVRGTAQDFAALQVMGHGAVAQVDREFLHRALGGEVVHQIQHQLLNDAPKCTGAGFTAMGLLGDGVDGGRFELQLHVVHAQQGAELLHQGVAGLGED